MTRRGHVPKRLCAGCGKRFAKKELIRFTVAGSGSSRDVVLDKSGKSGGRGAYVCAESSCLEKALKKKALLRGMGKAAIPAGLLEDFNRLEKPHR
ncbi:MAG: YlxR family protein [Actinomycetota bacterium]